MREKMRVSTRGYEVRVPAGTYFLGDPCYAVPDDQWMDLLESCGFFGAEPSLPGAGPVGIANGHEVLAFGTAWGDGEYTDQFGCTYAVDAGLIGLTPVEIGFRYTVEELERLGRIVKFGRDVTATDDGEGRLTFGQFSINTADDDMADWWGR